MSDKKQTLTKKRKKRFQRTEKHGLTQYAMTYNSYKPNEDHTNDSVDIETYTARQQQNKLEEQLFLHVSNYMKDEIETLGEKARKKNANPKDIKLLNRVNKAAACFVAIYIKMKDEDFPTLEKMDKHMKKKEKKENDKKFDSECSEDYPESDNNE